MLSWLLQTLGISDDIRSSIDQAQLIWARPVILWVGIALLVPIAFFIVRRQRNNLPHVSAGLRWLLSACRVGILLVLIVILAGPSLRLTREVTQKPILAVVLDESASMDLPLGVLTDEEMSHLAVAAGLLPPPQKDKPPTPLSPEVRKKLNGYSRAQLLDAVLTHNRETVIKPLKERFDLRLYRAARQIRSGDLAGEPAKPLSADEAKETDLGGAMDKAIDEAVGRRLAGLVVISDGRWTSGPDPMSVIERLGGTADDASVHLASHDENAPPLRTPVWSIPVGSSTALVDVSLADVLAPRQVARKDTIAVVATVDSSGLNGKSVQVKLTAADGKVIDTKPLTLNSAERQQVQLSFTAEEPGATMLNVAIDSQPEEQVKDNNQQTIALRVETEKQQLLYLEGYPRWDFRFLDHALRRDNGLDTTIVMEAQLIGYGVLPGDMPKVAKLPQDAAGFAQYNTVLLGDISSNLLPVKLQEQLVKAVEEDGLGLIVQAGPHHMPRGFLNGPLARILPVRFGGKGDASGTVSGSSLTDGSSVNILVGIDAPAFDPFHMKVTATGAIHPVFQLYDNVTQNRDVWSRMPEFFWAAAAEDAGPTATVLAKVEGPGISRPLIAERYAGRGRVLYIGDDTTYRWRRNIGSHLFYRFWGQAIRYVARNKDRGGDSSWMEVSPSRAEPGDPVAIELYAVDANGKPLDRADVIVQITSGQGQEQATVARTAETGHFRGVWQPKAIGSYRLTYTDQRGKEVTGGVAVTGSGRELRKPSVDRDLLGSMADATGGGLLELDRIDKLPDVIQGNPITISQSHEQEIWDNWLTLILLVGLYCTDVGVRRLLGLT